MKKLLLRLYLLCRHVLRGKGLSRITWLRDWNFRIERFFLGERKEVARTGGLVIKLDPRESVAEKMQPYEPESTKILEDYLKNGDVFVDVGASVGWFTLHAARCVGVKGKVYAFEPEPNSCALLKENIAANGFESVVALRQAAVSRESGTATLYVTGDAWTWSSLEDPRKNYERSIEPNFPKGVDRTLHEYRVECISLDDCLPEKVDFVKVDVEEDSATEAVFEGMAKTIAMNPGIKLLIENPTPQMKETLAQQGFSYTFLDQLNGFFMRNQA